MEQKADNQLLDAALAYAKMGLPVFPCAPRRKVPITEHGYRDATTDEEQIQRWWRDQPDANVGMPTGRASGLIVIDVDPRSGGDISLEAIEAKYADLPDTVESQTGDGGRHLYFKHPGGHVPCSSGKVASGIDVKGDGGYVLLPPSVHAKGTTYVWEASSDIADRPPVACPGWLGDLLTKEAGKTQQGPTLGVLGQRGGNTIPAGRRNSTLASLAGGMRRNGMTHDEILAALVMVNAQRCDPPLSDDEVQRIAASIANYEPDSVSVALVEDHYGQMFRGDEREDAPPANSALEDPGPLPEELLHVPGFICQVSEHALATAPYPQPILAFAAALTLQAFLAGRKVSDAADNRTNLYVLALANSGAGKDHPRKVNQRICIEVGLQDCLGDSFASGEGIEDRMFITPSLLFQTDEIDGLMNAINRASDARHESIMNALLKFYTSSNGLYPMRVKAGKQSPGVIDQPSLCVFGTAVPKYYYEALSVRMLNNGFFARLLILDAGKRGRGQTPVARPIPNSILATARWWVDFRPGGAGANLQNWHPIPAVVRTTPAADGALEDCRTFADDRYAEAEEKDDPAAMAIWARAYEKARKLALIYAVSENHLNPCIGEQAVRWAWRFVDHQTHRMLFMASQHVAEGEFDAKCKRMVEVLTSWRHRRGEAWMPHWELARRLKWSDKDIEEVRNALRSQRRIDYDVGSTSEGGRVGQRYRLSA